MKVDAIWQIEGTLETMTPLHIGDGGTARYDEELDAEIQTAAKTEDNRGRIPGAALKGVLSSVPEDETTALDLFGSPERGGLAQFLDAYSEAPIEWRGSVVARTAIDPISGAAQEHQLFTMERIPEGTKFNVRIRGKAAEQEEWKQQVAMLQRRLMEFNSGDLRLGACESNHWGCCRWTLNAVRVMDPQTRRVWLANPEPIDVALGKLSDRKAETSLNFVAKPARGKAIPISLRFDEHHLLVNDPGKTRRKAGKEDDDSHAHVARRRDGRLLLPAESFRGVLSHQAARISRTRGHRGDRATVLRDIDGNLPRDVSSLTRLFGGPGWETVLSITDFLQRDGAENSTVQQFLAVDRFTGGGAEERKFDAEGGWQPHLEGKIVLDLDRLGLLGTLGSALGLLALTLRDLIEGDLSFGWGGGKGYGWATVQTDGLSATAWVEHQLAGCAPGTVKDWIGEWERTVT